MDLGEPIPFEELGIGEESVAADFYRDAGVYSAAGAEGSPNAVTREDAVGILSERGFDGPAADSRYSDGGAAASPVYTVAYEAEAGDWWEVSLIDGDLMAVPVSYALENPGSEVVVSEHPYITSYDAESGMVLRLVPGEGSCEVRTVDRIDAGELDGLSGDELGAER